MNISVSTPLRISDQALGCGFKRGDRRCWTGSLLAESARQENADPWSGKSSIPRGTFEFFGVQVGGMSGCLVVNGFGVTGVSFATALSDLNKTFNGTRTNQVWVLPIKYVQDCISNNREKFKTWEQCELVNVINPGTIQRHWS